jgi:hypothetical protein
MTPTDAVPPPPFRAEPDAGEPAGPRGLVRRLGGAERPRFSLCVMVTRWEEYRYHLASFARGGFDAGCCEFLVLDNSAGNRADAYLAVNEFLGAARGDYVVLVHHDVALIADGRAELDRCLAELDGLDPHWGLCGNAGHTADGRRAICISHPLDEREVAGDLPARVVSLDENFLLVRRVANLAASRDLSGFHHYGPDLCIVADILGWSAWVIPFFVRHNSAGTIDERYARSRAAIAAKYRRALRPRWVHIVTRQPFYLSASAWGHRTAGLRLRIAKLTGRIPRNRDL